MKASMAYLLLRVSRLQQLCWLLVMLLAACGVSAKSIYMVGNSVTDTVDFKGFDAMAKSKGYEHVWGRHIIPGAPLEWIWNHPDDGFTQKPFGGYQQALKKNEWDVITLQPFDRRQPNDLEYLKRYIDLSMKMSPDATIYVVARWPRKSYGDFSKHWQKPYSGHKKNNFDDTNVTKDYFETLVAELKKQRPEDAERIAMIPIGHVMHALNEKIQNDKVPGISDIFSIYEDDIHLDNIGRFIVGSTFFTTIYRTDPRGMTPPKNYEDIDAKTADVILEIVWEVVSQHPLTKFEIAM